MQYLLKTFVTKNIAKNTETEKLVFGDYKNAFIITFKI